MFKFNNKIKNSLEWIKVNITVRGDDKITISSEMLAWAKEILILVDADGDQLYTTTCPISLLTSNSRILLVGSSYYNNTTYSYINVNISNTFVQMRNVLVNGVNKKTTSYLTVYIR